jgi:hypothetical protein
MFVEVAVPKWSACGSDAFVAHLVEENIDGPEVPYGGADYRGAGNRRV